MTCASLESAMLRWVHAPNKGMRRIAILMFNDCSLQGAGVVAEVFQAANELASSGSGGWLYDAITAASTRCMWPAAKAHSPQPATSG